MVNTSEGMLMQLRSDGNILDKNKNSEHFLRLKIHFFNRERRKCIFTVE